MTDTAIALARQIRRGERSALECLEATLGLIEEKDPALNCFTLQTTQRARAEAAHIDARRASGEALPPLAGVPYAVKNLYDIEGEVTLAGARVNQAKPPAGADARLVARLKSAGAVLVGALNMDEHAYGFTGENSHYGPTRNPHDLARVPGGSSGGAAAAVAAGLVPLTLGSDTSGSIRVPASCCGVFGLKPTYGRLPRTGTFPFVDSLDHLGPFAGGMQDLVLAYNLLQGPDADDPVCSLRAAEPVALASLQAADLRVGVLGGWFEHWAGPDARRAVEIAAAALEAQDRVEWPAAEAARSAAFILTGAEGGALHRRQLIERYGEYEPASRDRLIAGSLIPAAWVVKAQQLRRHAAAEMRVLFERYDLLIAPAAPCVAPRLGTDLMDINGRQVPARATLGVLTQPISCIGLPVCAVPLWPDPNGVGLPIGVQLIAPPWREDLCLAAGAALERLGVAGARTAGI